MESWYFVVNGVQTGPVSMAELKEAAATGKLTPEDLVWQEGTADWVPARTVAGLFPSTPPVLPRPTPAQPTYGLSPPPPSSAQAAMTLPPTDAEAFSLDDEPAGPPRTPRNRPADLGPAAGMPDWLNLVQVFARRAFTTNPTASTPTPDEETALTRSGVMDPTARKVAVWRRSMLFVAAVPCAFAALFSLIDVIAMEKKEREPFSAFGLFLFYIEALALFALPVAAVLGALAYDRLAASAKWVLIGGLVSLATPIAVAFVPTDWRLDVKTDSSMTVAQAEEIRTSLGLLVGITLYITLMPTVLSLLPAVSRACVRVKLFLPESLAPGWGLITSIPLCVLLTLATFVMVYHVAGNALLILGLVLWIGAPLLYLSKFNLLTRPVTSPTDQDAIVRTSLIVFALILLGMFCLVIFLFTGKFGGLTILGFDEKTSATRPWNIGLHKIWIEYVGRSLFLTVFFADILVWVALSVWREERAFAGSPQAATFDQTMNGLGSAVLPRGTPPAP